MIQSYEKYLKQSNLAKNTISVYLFSVKQFHQLFGEITKPNLKEYKVYLIENFKPQTVNLRLRAVNSYLEFIKKEKWKLTFVKVQQKPFLENVISEADYNYFKKCLKQDNDLYWYFVIRFMAATGARVSELIQLKCEHIQVGYFDLYSKGGKLRRIYIPEKLQDACLNWLQEQNRRYGFIFLNKYGERDPIVVNPHSIRHRFAKSFLERCNDITFLADLMGHESIETTRIYLRKTSTEQQAIINKIIDW